MPFAEINNAYQTLQPLNTYSLLNSAIANAPRASAAQFLASLEVALRNQVNGWHPREFPFTSIQPPAQGRPRAIDFCNTGELVGIEVELSNQNAISHDLLKLETAFHNQYIVCGVLVVPTAATRNGNQWPNANYYSTFEYAEEWLKIYAPSLKSPILVWGF